MGSYPSNFIPRFCSHFAIISGDLFAETIGSAIVIYAFAPAAHPLLRTVGEKGTL